MEERNYFVRMKNLFLLAVSFWGIFMLLTFVMYSVVFSQTGGGSLRFVIYSDTLRINKSGEEHFVPVTLKDIPPELMEKKDFKIQNYSDLKIKVIKNSEPRFVDVCGTILLTEYVSRSVIGESKRVILKIRLESSKEVRNSEVILECSTTLGGMTKSQRVNKLPADIVFYISEYDSGFRPERDAVAFPNFATPKRPGGSCYGIAALVTWHYLKYAKFDQQNRLRDKTNYKASPEYLFGSQATLFNHMAILAQEIYETRINMIGPFVDAGESTVDSIFKLLKQGIPAILTLRVSKPTINIGANHAVVCYKAFFDVLNNEYAFLIYDPNQTEYDKKLALTYGNKGFSRTYYNYVDVESEIIKSRGIELVKEPTPVLLPNYDLVLVKDAVIDINSECLISSLIVGKSLYKMMDSLENLVKVENDKFLLARAKIVSEGGELIYNPKVYGDSNERGFCIITDNDYPKLYARWVSGNAKMILETPEGIRNLRIIKQQGNILLKDQVLGPSETFTQNGKKYNRFEVELSSNVRHYIEPVPNTEIPKVGVLTFDFNPFQRKPSEKIYKAGMTGDNIRCTAWTDGKGNFVGQVINRVGDPTYNEIGVLEITEDFPVRRVEITGSGCTLPVTLTVNGISKTVTKSHDMHPYGTETLVFDIQPSKVVKIYTSVHNAFENRGFRIEEIKLYFE